MPQLVKGNAEQDQGIGREALENHAGPVARARCLYAKHQEHDDQRHVQLDRYAPHLGHSEGRIEHPHFPSPACFDGKQAPYTIGQDIAK